MLLSGADTSHQNCSICEAGSGDVYGKYCTHTVQKQQIIEGSFWVCISHRDAPLKNVLSFGMSTCILLIDRTMSAAQCQDVNMSTDTLCCRTQGESEVRPFRGKTNKGNLINTRQKIQLGIR